MYRKSWQKRFSVASLLVCIGVMVGGTKACQEDYEFAKQVSVTPNPTSDGDISTDTPTETPTDSFSEDPVETSIPEDDASPTSTPDVSIPIAEGGGDKDESLFTELSTLTEVTSSTYRDGRAARVAAQQNWLGEAFVSEEEGDWIDSDGDGYSDDLESLEGSDSRDRNSVPSKLAHTDLQSRLGEVGVSLDMLQNGSAESVLPGGSVEGERNDSDGDGVPDDIEESRGMNAFSMDSDSDGLRDDRELLIGSNPLRTDSDQDGVSDMQEVMLGSDPTIRD